MAGSGATSTLYDYNADKQITRITRPDGGLLEYDYDSTGRLATLTIPQGQYGYAYSPVGQLASVTAPGAIDLDYAYSGALLTSLTWSGPITGSVGYGYDTDFRVNSLTVNGANPIAYQYDPDSLLVQAGALSLTRKAQNGLLTGTALGAATDSYTHNAFGELSGHTARHGATDLLTVAYTRDALGRITEKTETVQGTTTTTAYTYDLIGQLIEVRRNGSLVASYSYDPNGNRLSKTGPGISETGTYDAQDRLLSYAGATYEYTANGELERKVQGGQTTTYAYDALGNLRQVTLPDGRALEYLIDGQNRRIGKRIDGTLVQGFLYQGQLQPVAELDGNGNVVSRFVYATGINVPDYLIRDGQTYRLIKDHLGSPRLVVNTATGEVVQRLDYDEYGQVLTDTNPGFQPFGFAGGIDDRDTGLVRFGARDYDPRTGRWTAKDPIGFGGGSANLYTYTSGDPINYIDTFGLSEIRRGITKGIVRGSLSSFVVGFITGKIYGPFPKWTDPSEDPVLNYGYSIGSMFYKPPPSSPAPSYFDFSKADLGWLCQRLHYLEDKQRDLEDKQRKLGLPKPSLPDVVIEGEINAIRAELELRSELIPQPIGRAR